MTQGTGCNLIFVYGTLRKDPAHELSRILTRNASFVGEASARGRLFDLGSYPGMVLSTSPGELVIGELYEIAPDRLHAVLGEIDRHEGCSPTDPTPHEYRRERIVSTFADVTVMAWAYLLNRPTYDLDRIRSGDYLEWRKSRESHSAA